MTDLTDLFSITLHGLAPVGALMLLGLLGGKAARLLHLPKVSGYILTGIVIGPSVLGLVSTEIVQSISVVNDIALGLIMFAIGGTFEIHHIKSVGKKILWLTVAQAVGTLVITALGLILFGVDAYPALLLGTIAIATAPAATLLVVREFEAKGEFTDTLITVTATSNVVCILAFEFVYSAISLTEGSNLIYALLSPVYELGGSLVIGFLVGYLVSKWEQRIDDQAELLMIIVAGIMLVTGLSLTLNLQPLFGTLIMGAIVTNFSMMHRLVYVEIRHVEQPLYIAFFVLAGASLHLDLLWGLGMAGLVYLVARVAGKSISIWAVSKWRGFNPSIGHYLGPGLVAQAGVAIGLVEMLGKTNPEIAATVTPIILSSILVYETLGPPIIEWVLFRVGDVKKFF